jgi:hypothetical protein
VLPFSFFLDDSEIMADLKAAMDEKKSSREDVLMITYQPQAVFRVKSVTRCTGSMAGKIASNFHSSCESRTRRLCSLCCF